MELNRLPIKLKLNLGKDNGGIMKITLLRLNPEYVREEIIKKL